MLHPTLRTIAVAVIIFLLVAVGSVAPSSAEESPEESPPEETDGDQGEDADWADRMNEFFELLCPEDLDFICPDGGAKLEGDGSV